MKKTILTAILLLAFVITLVACGSREETNDYNPQPHGDVTISVLAPAYLYPLLNMVAPLRTAHELMQQSWYESGRGTIYLDITTYTHETIYEHMLRLRVMLMAGQGYDMFFLNHDLSLWTLAQSGFLEDIYTLIDQNPNTNRDDFWDNALDAFTINGGLYGFPLYFGFEYVAINATLPQEIIDRFTALEFITDAQMLEIYLELQNPQYQDYWHLVMANCFRYSYDPVLKLQQIIDSFIDYENLTSNLLDAGFVSLLTNIQQRPRKQQSPRNIYTWDSIDLFRWHSESFVFQTVVGGSWQIYGVLPVDNTNFTHFIPIVDTNGRLSMPAFTTWLGAWPVVCIVRAGNSAVAWELTQYMVSLPRIPDHTDFRNSHANYFSTPITRKHFEPHFNAIYDYLAAVSQQVHRGTRPGNRAFYQAVEAGWDDAMELLIMYNNMPIAPPPFMPINLIKEPLDLMMHGIITPQEAAQRMHNAVSLWLIE